MGCRTALLVGSLKVAGDKQSLIFAGVEYETSAQLLRGGVRHVFEN